MKRRQARLSNGRFTRSTLANTFGLRVEVCPNCRAMNPYAINELAPKTCHVCGQALCKITKAEGHDEGRGT